jgi:hypothetical protein
MMSCFRFVGLGAGNTPGLVTAFLVGDPVAFLMGDETGFLLGDEAIFVFLGLVLASWVGSINVFSLGPTGAFGFFLPGLLVTAWVAWFVGTLLRTGGRWAGDILSFLRGEEV